jgi:hypothetical protein
MGSLCSFWRIICHIFNYRPVFTVFNDMCLGNTVVTVLADISLTSISKDKNREV